MSLLNSFVARKRRYDDISVSIQEHIDERIDELMDQGISRGEAENRAAASYLPARRTAAVDPVEALRAE